jgi:hypothetical protein
LLRAAQELPTATVTDQICWNVADVSVEPSGVPDTGDRRDIARIGASDDRRVAVRAHR